MADDAPGNDFGMKIARFNGGKIGIVTGDRIVDVTKICGVDPGEWPPVGMNRVIANFAELRPKIEAALAIAPSEPLANVRLETPNPWPHKLLAMPSNFAAHSAEMKTNGFGLANSLNADEAGFFMKSNGSLIGSAEPIVIPDRPGRTFHHECEMATIIGTGGNDIPAAKALDHIFGYACLIDVTMRGAGERVMRKSFDSFCPVGPWITTADEVGAPDDIEMRLWVNGELRQHAIANEMIVGIREQVETCSSVTRLVPGDIIASGTMSGVGSLVPGDTVEIDIARVGRMKLAVTSRVAAVG
jgi:2-keto-4-pentenoate hydratase/2-oxohepta-3-ene-1,7-dioic acid hydratase in catechol pathway